MQTGINGKHNRSKWNRGGLCVSSLILLKGCLLEYSAVDHLDPSNLPLIKSRLNVDQVLYFTPCGGECLIVWAREAQSVSSLSLSLVSLLVCIPHNRGRRQEVSFGPIGESWFLGSVYLHTTGRISTENIWRSPDWAHLSIRTALVIHVLHSSMYYKHPPVILVYIEMIAKWTCCRFIYFLLLHISDKNL